MTRSVEYDIALSFAGEDRPYVEEVAHLLQVRGVSVFYDKFEEVDLWGKDLYTHLSDVYSNKAYYIVMFISKHYKEKLWTNHERQAMQSGAFQENREYILPARFDDTEIPGLLPTMGYISLIDRKPSELAEIIVQKLIASGKTAPSQNLRKTSISISKISKFEPSTFRVFVEKEQGISVSGAVIVLISDNNTFLRAQTDNNGVAKFEIKVRRSYKLFCANVNSPALIVDNIDPATDLKLQNYTSDNIGSVICENGTGYIPGLKGRLNPILDTSNRTYLYADNISINGGQQQPVVFKLNEPLELEDCDGTIMQVTIKAIQGSTSLIEFIS